MSKVDPGFPHSPVPPRKTRRAPKSRTLEFDLGLAPARASKAARAAQSPTAPQPDRSLPPTFRSGTRQTHSASPPHDPPPVSPPPEPSSNATPSADPTPVVQTVHAEPSAQKPSMNPTPPAPLNVKKTIERQSREQHAMSHILNGVAISFVCAIILVASLAGLGGYVLYKQLMNQSATIALLETNTLERFAELEGRLAARNRELAELQQETSLRLTTLQGQFDQYRSQTTQSISLLTSANARLERRLVEYRQELLRQEQLLSMNETPARRLR
ncbi:MAG: hypothetical protein SNJ84_01685 [Verrucomicrobiia bacterium]